MVSLTPSLIDISPGFHGSTATPSVLDPWSSVVFSDCKSKFPSDIFQLWRLMSDLDVSYSFLLDNTQDIFFRPWRAWALSVSLSHVPDGFLAFQPGCSG